jgi:hypothetical protein
MVVEIFVARGETENSLSQKLLDSVLDLIRIAKVLETGSNSADDVTLLVDLLQEDQASVRRDSSTVEVNGNFSSSRALKIELFGGTVCVHGVVLPVLVSCCRLTFYSTEQTRFPASGEKSGLARISHHDRGESSFSTFFGPHHWILRRGTS